MLSADSSLWNHCLRALKSELPEQQFNTWVRPLQAVDEGTALRLLAPNRFVVDWVQQHYLPRILELVAENSGEAELVLEVGSREGPVAAAPTPSRPATPCSWMP